MKWTQNSDQQTKYLELSGAWFEKHAFHFTNNSWTALSFSHTCMGPDRWGLVPTKKNKGKDREKKKERIRMKVFLWSIKKRPFDYATGGCLDHDREGQMK